MTRPRVLVTDAGTTKALATVRALAPRCDVMTLASTRLALAAWSRYSRKHFVVRPRVPSEYGAAVLEACTRTGIDVVVPPEEQSSWLLARERAFFDAAGVKLAVPSVVALEVVMDKAQTLDAARRAGVPVPRSALLTEVDQLQAAARSLGFPLVIKPRFSNYWTGHRFVATDGVAYARSEPELTAQIRAIRSSLPLPILQEFIPGRGHGVFLMLGAGGEVLGEFAHERLRDLRPTGSGSVLRRSVPLDSHLRGLAVELLRHIGWRGVAMVEFRDDDRDGVPKLMEINGRLWGSLQLATDAGVNFPQLLVDDALGRATVNVGYAANVVVRWWLGDVARLGRVFKGRPPGYASRFPGRLEALREFLGPQPPGTRQEVLRWDDPLPALGEIVSALARRQ